MRTVTKLPVTAVKTPKTVCPVTFAEFARNSEPCPSVAIAGQVVHVEGREFSTGTLGWMHKGKPMLTIKLANGTEVKCTVDLKLYVQDSKQALRLGDDPSVLNPAYLARLSGTPEPETVG
jgi:hypothetical protein